MSNFEKGNYEAAPPMPTQYQGYNMPPGSVPMQGPVLQQPQAVYVTPVQPVNEPDYLGLSIFTTICCCLPLGIAAIIFSVQTRGANQAGNLTAAKKNSRLARILAFVALGLGIGFMILYIALVVLSTGGF